MQWPAGPLSGWPRCPGQRTEPLHGLLQGSLEELSLQTWWRSAWGQDKTARTSIWEEWVVLEARGGSAREEARMLEGSGIIQDPVGCEVEKGHRCICQNGSNEGRELAVKQR